MNALGKLLARSLTVHFQTRVAPLQPNAGPWRIVDDPGDTRGDFDLVVSSAPAAQTAELLGNVSEAAERARQVRMSGCWAVMLASRETIDVDFDGAFVNESPLSWIARNNSKPDRTKREETWVLHGSPEWTESHLESDKNEVVQALLSEFWRVVDCKPHQLDHCVAHLWRYALPPDPLADTCLYDEKAGVAACGDWCAGPRVEGAFLSGVAVAGRILGAALRA